MAVRLPGSCASSEVRSPGRDCRNSEGSRTLRTSLEAVSGSCQPPESSRLAICDAGVLLEHLRARDEEWVGTRGSCSGRGTSRGSTHRSGRDELPTNEDHRPTASLGAFLRYCFHAGVTLLLCADGPPDRGLKPCLAIGLGHGRPQKRKQIGLGRREEAGLEIAISRNPQAIACAAKVLSLSAKRGGSDQRLGGITAM